jgi:flagellar protein FlaG
MTASGISVTNGPNALATMSRGATVSPSAATEAAAERQDVSAGGKVSPQQPESEVTREAVQKAVSDISDYVQKVSRELQFQVDDDIGDTIITVVDRETGDIIRQIPSSEVVQLARYIAENAPDPVTGLLVNSEGLN